MSRLAAIVSTRRLAFGIGASLLLWAPTFAAAEITGPTRQVYQQRTADGRLLLTDRPSPEALTERTWLVPAEDAAAARQRALDIQQQANIVAERVQRRLIEQERLAAASARAAEPRRDSRRYDDDDSDAYDGYGGYGGPVLIGGPLRYGSGRNGFGRLGGYERRDGHSARGRSSTRFTGPATPGSR